MPLFTWATTDPSGMDTAQNKTEAKAETLKTLGATTDPLNHPSPFQKQPVSQRLDSLLRYVPDSLATVLTAGGRRKPRQYPT